MRNGSNVFLNVRPEIIIERDRFGGEYKVGRIGIMAEQDPSFYQIKEYNLFSGLLRGIQETFSLTSKILSYLGQLIIGRESVDQMGGPIKIIQVSKFISILIGSIIGFFSGLVGIGGGIFLSPLLFLLKAPFFRGFFLYSNTK